MSIANRAKNTPPTTPWAYWIAMLIFVGIAAFIIIFVYKHYSSAFTALPIPKVDAEFTEAKAAWGQFGDYFGGTINPILSFLSLIALLATIGLQVHELRATRYELSQTRDIANEQASHFTREGIKSEIIQSLDILEKEVEERLNKMVYTSNGNSTIRSQLAGWASAMAANQPLVLARTDFSVSPWKEFYEVSERLADVNRLLGLYQGQSTIPGTAPLVTIYKRNYQITAATLVYSGLFPNVNYGVLTA